MNERSFPVSIPIILGTILAAMMLCAAVKLNITPTERLVESCWRRAQYSKYYRATRDEVASWVGEIQKHDQAIGDTLLFCSMIDYESSWNPTARSKKGAHGLLQIMPATAKEYCKKNKIKFGSTIERALYNPIFNIRIGIGLYTETYQKWNYEDHLLPMAIWNSGCGNIGRYIENGNGIRGTFWKDVQESRSEIEAARSRIIKRGKEGEQ